MQYLCLTHKLTGLDLLRIIQKLSLEALMQPPRRCMDHGASVADYAKSGLQGNT